MSDTSIQVTQGSGTRLRTNDRSIGGQTVHVQAVFLDDWPLATYAITANNISIATVNDHILQIMAGSTLNVYVRRLEIRQAVSATNAGRAAFEFRRLTTAGTGGSSITPATFDTTDGAAGATAMTLPSAKGTESTVLWFRRVIMTQAIATTGTQVQDMFVWEPTPKSKSIRIPAGTANGVVLKSVVSIPGAAIDVYAEIVEANY